MREKEPSCSSVLPTTDFLFMSNFSTFECQVDTHEDRVYRIARSYLKDTPTAQDVTQEVLVKLWKHQEELDEDGLMAWLTCVTRNACIDKLRARQRRRKAVRVDADGLDRVDDPYREVVALREVQGLKYKEIAETLDMPLNTVKVYLHRGRKKLQAQLDRALDLAVA